ncbi:hypothetical protein Afil01_50880 [Actinorhabdospora filicis]|uniref:Uncharacterized protein n=1 Tax=Actinorhabdospora filicis TaxID=1785913 RepID=A0A9W6SQA5_9ACTN|nr:hypothetical protein Afil01_50880 [Actinorhabdospora filicis]
MIGRAAGFAAAVVPAEESLGTRPGRPVNQAMTGDGSRARVHGTAVGRTRARPVTSTATTCARPGRRPD